MTSPNLSKAFDAVKNLIEEVEFLEERIEKLSEGKPRALIGDDWITARNDKKIRAILIPDYQRELAHSQHKLADQCDNLAVSIRSLRAPSKAPAPGAAS